ncbi:MAG: 4-hydroxy-tetrahydrodipicolinate synthase [Bacteroidia bacterium]|nr:4-hydroxy-tetrahydrodipicolinate synthase [Bacteroidia bacterium]
MNYKKLRGTGVAIITPFRKDGHIDFNGLESLINYIVDGGVDYLVVLGTTGESVTLNKDEKLAVIDFVKDTNNGRVPIVLGCGGNNTQDVLNSIGEYDFNGIDAILSVSPYYNKPTDKGIYNHYKAIAGACPVPIILYNVPSRTGSNMSAELTLKLAKDFDNIIAVKEASGDISQCMDIINNKPEDFLVISGDDALTLPIIACGGDGVISVAANALPQEMGDLVKYALKQQMDKARTAHYNLLELIHLLFVEGNPAGVKEVLSQMKICQHYVRLPLVNVSKKTANRLEKAVKDMERVFEYSS